MATFEELMRDAVARKVVPGAVLVATNRAGLPNVLLRKCQQVLTIHPGTFNYAETFGYAGLAPNYKPLQLDSTFYVASCTRLMTTICALQCVEKGLFSLDSSEDVKRPIPEMAGAEILTGFDAASEGAPAFQEAGNKSHFVKC